MGYWLDINGEAIYNSKPWKYQNDTTNPDVWYTMSSSSNDTVYAILLKYPTDTDKKVFISAPYATASTDISLLGYSGQIQWVAPPRGGLSLLYILLCFLVI